MRLSGAESLAAAANVFVGQTEAPLLVKPFVKTMTHSELMAVMTGGFATVAGGVLALYVAFLRDIPGIAGHLVAASFMGAPGALAVAKIMFPETEEPVTAGEIKVPVDRPDANAIEAHMEELGGCSDQGIFFVRDSIYGDGCENSEEPVYDYGGWTGNNYCYSDRITNTSYNWVRYLSNHAYSIHRR